MQAARRAAIKTLQQRREDKRQQAERVAQEEIVSTCTTLASFPGLLHSLSPPLLEVLTIWGRSTGLSLSLTFSHFLSLPPPLPPPSHLPHALLTTPLRPSFKPVVRSSDPSLSARRNNFPLRAKEKRRKRRKRRWRKVGGVEPWCQMLSLLNSLRYCLDTGNL